MNKHITIFAGAVATLLMLGSCSKDFPNQEDGR